MTLTVAPIPASSSAIPASADVPAAAASRATASSTAASSGTAPALYQTLTTVFPSGALGLRSPLNVEDSQIVLARLALAIDAATAAVGDARIGSAAGNVRGSIARFGQALTGLQDLAGAFAKATSDLEARQAESVTLPAERRALVAQRDDLEARLDGLRSARANAPDDAAPEIDRQIADVEAQVGATTADIQALDLRIAALPAAIEAATAQVAQSRDDLAAGSQAVLFAFSVLAQLPSVTDEADGTAVASSALDRSIDDSVEILRTLLRNGTALAERDAQQSDDRKDRATERAAEIAHGLALGIADALDLLLRLVSVPDVHPADATAAAGRRLQLALCPGRARTDPPCRPVGPVLRAPAASAAPVREKGMSGRC